MASNGAESCEGIRKPAIQLRRSRSAVGSRPESRSANRMSSAVKMRERRVKSALESRREQEASAVFPEVKVDLKWGVTKYSEDYCPKKRSTPVPIRPASPTRMNNPHPAQPFLTWIYPTRIHKHNKAISPPKEAWRFIQESFYEDYTDTCNTGDAKNEVPITNLAKIDFPGEQKQNQIVGSTPQLGGISGIKVPLNQRQGKGNKSIMKSQTTPAPSKELRTIQATLRGNSLPVFKQWLKIASSQERDVVLRMLQAGYTDTEEVRLKKAVGKVLRPDSVVKVQEWLKSASESERQIVLNVLESLIEATNDATDSEYLPPYYYYASGFGHHRSHTYPVSLGRHRVPHLKDSKQKIRCRRCSTAKRDEGCDDVGLGLTGKKIDMDSSKKSKHLNPQLWQNRIIQQHGGATIVHAASVFSQPKKDRGQHYSIHPEWPTA